MRNNELFDNLDKLHTTELGIVRIKKNLSLECTDVVEWCRMALNSGRCIIERKGKNYYVNFEENIITINAFSYTIITAHRIK